jgi:hypothetical protein
VQDTFAPLNGGVWKSNVDRWGNYSHGIRISDNAFMYFTIINNADVIRNGTTNRQFDTDLGHFWTRCYPVDLTGKIHNGEFTVDICRNVGAVTFTISRDSQTISEYHEASDGVASYEYVFKRLK